MRDDEAHRAIWQAIHDALNKLESRYNIRIPAINNRGLFPYSGTEVPDLQTWQLVEVLSLLMIMSRAEDLESRRITNIFGKLGPVHLIEDGKKRYLWTQPSLKGQSSELGGRPDLLVTSTSESPTSTNILRVIECKAQRELTTTVIRQEFGKAFDLGVSSYHIWSLNTPKLRIIEGAKGLGLDLVSLEFDTERRLEFVRNPEALEAFVGDKLEESRREGRFPKMLSRQMDLAGRKLLER